MNIEPYRTLLEPHDLTFLTGAPYLYHCHHYNLFHDQTIDDILGDERGAEIRFEAARGAFRQLLSNLTTRLGMHTAAERIQLAQSVFAAAGHGKITLEVTPEGGTAWGQHIHYGFTWAEKYGARAKRVAPADAVAAGFCAAATEVAYDLPDGAMRATETACTAQRDPACRFSIQPGERIGSVAAPIDQRAYEAALPPSTGALFESRLDEIADKLQGFLLGVSGDDRGLVQAFGVFVTLHLANYYNATVHAAIRDVEERAPASAPTAESLLREAGHVCVFNTFGGILKSPEWEAVAGKLIDDPREIVVGATAIARGLGFGRWAIGEFESNTRLVVSTTSNYEASFWKTHGSGAEPKPRCYFFQGAVMAFMVLAHRVRWSERPELSQRFYDELFRGEGLGFTSRATRCAAMGHDRCEVVIERAR